MLSVNMSIVYTVINLLILLVLMRIFLFKPVDKILKERQKEIEDAHLKAEEEQKAAEASKTSYEAQMEKADAEKDKIISDAKDKGYTEYEAILKRANAEADSIVDAAKQAAEEEKKKRMRQYDAQIVDMVVDAAAKIAATKHTPEQDNDLYNEFVDLIGSDDEWNKVPDAAQQEKQKALDEKERQMAKEELEKQNYQNELDSIREKE